MVKQPQFCDVTFPSNGLSFKGLEHVRLQMMLGLWQSDGSPKAFLSGAAAPAIGSQFSWRN